MSDLERRSPFYLIERFVQGKCSAEESQELLRYLRENDKNGEILYKNLLSDIWLHDIFDGGQKGQFIPDNQTDIMKESLFSRAELDLFDIFSQQLDPKLNTTLICHDPVEILPDGSVQYPMSRISSLPRSQRRSFRSKFFLTLCGVVLLIGMILFGGLFYLPRSESNWADPFEPIAQIVETVSPVWEEGSAVFRRGQKIGANRLQLKGGLVQLRFMNGTELILQGPCQFVINGEKNTLCQRGRVSAKVAKGAEGFEIITPYTSVIDRGTEFAVDVSDAAARVDVVLGRVDLVTAKELHVVPLTTGEASRVNSNFEVSRIPFNQNQYIDSDLFKKQLNKDVRQQLELKKEENNILFRNKKLLVHLDFSGGKAKVIPNNSMTGMAQIPSARVQRCSSDDGDLYSTKSIRFDRKDDAVQLDLSGKYETLTLSARVRIDELANQGNVLFSTNNFSSESGGFLWQILKNGRVQLLVNIGDEGGNARNKGVANFTSEKVLQSDLYGVWLNLTVTINTKKKTIVHYCDGNPIGISRWDSPVPLQIAGGTIGNNCDTNAGKNIRALGGAMSEFHLINGNLIQSE